ncbi:polyamine ABC transporter substrate-binding protein [soil metagenome]
MRQTTLTAAAALLAGPLAAQDVVHVFNWSDYIAEDTIARFEAETGISVVYDVYDSNDMLEARLLAGSSGYDVVVPTSSYLHRQVAAGVYMPLDRSLIPNAGGLDPGQMAAAADHDPGNEHSVIYMWGTNGIGYNAAMVEERLGADAPTDSWALVFDPENASALADCGISFLDSAGDMFPVALQYLGLDPHSTDEAELEQAAGLIEAVRPHVRTFHSSQYISDLANGEICVAVGWSGDVFIAMDRAEAAGQGVEIDYAIPVEGTIEWFDLMAIPADAPNPEAAHAFINFVLQPDVIADITNYVFYPNAVPASLEHVEAEIAEDPAIYPPREVLDGLFPSPIYDARADRIMTRLWTRVRTRQ